jgi:hypothetical protein
MTPVQRKLLKQALKDSSRADLLKCLVDLAATIPEVWQALEARLRLEPRTTPDLVSRTQVAIRRATDFDERDINRNFDYDYDAYEQIPKYFRQLAESGLLETAMDLAIELLSAGSYQVEMSDEGLMWHEIESCLDVISDAVERSQLPSETILLWIARMEQSDRMEIFTRGKEAWTRSYPPQVWSAIADELVGMLSAKPRDRPLSERRREIIVHQATHALTRAGRAAEIPKLDPVPTRPSRSKRRRRA